MPGRQDEVRRSLIHAGVCVLDEETYEAPGVGFTGVKAVAGDFGRGVAIVGPAREQGVRLLQREYPDRPPFRLVEVPAVEEAMSPVPDY